MISLKSNNWKCIAANNNNNKINNNNNKNNTLNSGCFASRFLRLSYLFVYSSRSRANLSYDICIKFRNRHDMNFHETLPVAVGFRGIFQIYINESPKSGSIFTVQFPRKPIPTFQNIYHLELIIDVKSFSKVKPSKYWEGSHNDKKAEVFQNY